jgi:hypothetical protein
MSAVAVALFLAATPPAPAPLPDISAPLGRLVDVLVDPGTQPLHGEKIVEAELKGCDHKISLHVTHFVSGAMDAQQQLAEWTLKTPGLEGQLFSRKNVYGEVLTALGGSLAADVHACAALPKTVASAPKLCPGAAPNEVWLLDAKKKPAALVRWEPSSKGCLPRISTVFFDAKGAARLRYDADFAGAVAVTIVGDKCSIDFTFDADKQMFHAARRGCKGP